MYLEYAAEFKGDRVGLRSLGVPSESKSIYLAVEKFSPSKRLPTYIDTYFD